ncbi:TetR family transcriptional regulator [Cellulomonas chitinilytica]|uniref:TetR family transcriptional regulator n=1 Tax=Cellulomonas chitinilytica TaxID=398759 RepID=A0A919P3R0_9CELL|nr:TetR family transcriptional regulator [Cellulomonas chitinilytica]
MRVLWGAEGAAARGPRPRQSLPQVAEAAVRLADAHGLESVTLANVARELGMTTSAIYRYVDSKDVLVELMVDRAVGEPPTLTAATWQGSAREWAGALRERYRRHPWLAQVTPSGPPRVPNPIGWIAGLVEALSSEPGIDGMRVALLLDALVRSYSAVSRASQSAPPPEWLTGALSARFPVLTSGMHRDWSDPDEELAFALDVVLAGLAAP